MRAGRLRHRITIQENQPMTDAYGQPVENWVDVATVWGAVEPQRAVERFVDEANQLLASRTTLIVIRYRTGVSVESRVSWSGLTFNIRSIVNPDWRNRELQLTCEEVGVS